MRITIGHLLILSALGGIAYVNLPESIDIHMVKSKLGGVKSEFKSLLNLFKSGEAEQENFKNGKTETPAAIPIPTVPPPKAVPPAAPKPAKVKSAPKRARKKAVKKSVRKKSKKKVAKRKAKRKPKKVAKAPAPKKSAAQSAREEIIKELIGNYVSLQLTTGRQVKGILKEKTADHYKIELPGMGPFVYPVKDVRNVKLAE